MIKIRNISNKILERHKNYIIEQNIIGKIEKLENKPEILGLFNDKEFKQEHIKFCGYIKEECKKLEKNSLSENIKNKNLFLANVFELNEIIGKTKKQFPRLSTIFSSNDNSCIKYTDEILNGLDYSNFSSVNMKDFFKLELDFSKKYNKTYICKRLREIKSVDKMHYTREEYNIFSKEIIKEIDYIQSINNNNGGYDKKLEELKNAIEKVSLKDVSLKQYSIEITSLISSWIQKYDYSFISIKNYKNYERRYKNKQLQWSAYDFVIELGVKVCPYCNRQYITPMYSKDGKVRADLDHFFPKSKYPYLSMSIYNLVPCCKFCNSSLKGDQEFTYEDYVNPYEKGIDDYMYFSYEPNSMKSFYGEDDIIIKLFEKKNVDGKILEKFKNNLKVFQIEEIYQYHTDIIKLLLKKKTIFSDKYLENFYENHKSIFKNKEELIDILFRDTLEVDEDSPFYKLKKDIIEEII